MADHFHASTGSDNPKSAMQAVCNSNTSLSSLASLSELHKRITDLNTRTSSLLLSTSVLQGKVDGLIEALGQHKSAEEQRVIGPGTRWPSLHRGEAELERERVIGEEMEKLRAEVAELRGEYNWLVKGSLEVRGVVEPQDREGLRELDRMEEKVGGLRVKLEGLEGKVGI